MTSRGRIAGVAGIAVVACLLGAGCAGEGGLRRFQPGAGSLPVGGTNPYVAMRPTYETPNGRRPSQPLYLAGYGGFNYTRTTTPAAVETAYDGRYYHSFFGRLFGGGQ